MNKASNNIEVIHVFANYPHHVVNMTGFISRLDKNLIRPLFFIQISSDRDKSKYQFLEQDSVRYYRDFSSALDEIKRRPKCPIVFHGLFGYEQWLSILLSGLFRQSVWICWGADLYKHVLPASPGKDLKFKTKIFIELWIKRLTLNRFLTAASLNEGDADLIRKKLWVKKSHSCVLRYPTFGVKASVPDRQASLNSEKEVVRIICGNSADPSNNHIEILDILKPFSGENIEIVMPLNYGADDLYINKICQHGKSIFGEKFKPLVDFLEKQEYDELLRDVDIGIFLHKRQQGLYVACSLILQGKLVYLREDVSSYKDFTHMGIHVRDSNRIADTTYNEFIDMPLSVAENNAKISKRILTEEFVAKDWEKFCFKLMNRTGR